MAWDAVQGLGGTIDEYYANFRVKFHKLTSPVIPEPADSAACGGIIRELLIEVTLPHRNRPEPAQRVRNVVLIDEHGRPGGVILIIRRNLDPLVRQGLLITTMDAISTPAAVMRLDDQSVVDVNAAFLQAAALDKPAALAQATAQLSAAGAADAIGAFKPVVLTQHPVDFDRQNCLLIQFSHPQHGAVALDCATVGAGRGAGPGEKTSGATVISASAEAVCAAAPAPVQVLDPDMRIRAVSGPWSEWLGYGQDAAIGRRASDFLSPASAEAFTAFGANILEETDRIHQLECQFVTRSGGVIDASLAARAVLDSAGELVCVIVSSVDMTERKRSGERFEKLFALVPIPMLIRRMDNARVTYANNAFMSAMGYAPEAIIGRTLDEIGLFENRAQRQQFEQDVRTQERLQGMDARIKGTLGETMDCLISGERINVQGDPCTLLLIEDVTDRRRNETQLFQAIQTVMADTSWFSRSVIEKLAVLRAPPRSGGRSAELGELTPREREVLGLISHGLSDIDIADKLRLTRSTVRNHVATLYSKIGVHSRSSAIVWARERGINIAWPSATTPNFMRPAAAFRKPENILTLKKGGA